MNLFEDGGTLIRMMSEEIVRKGYRDGPDTWFCWFECET